MSKPATEIALDSCCARIIAHRPHLAQSAFRFLNAGWDSDAVEVDGQLVFKFPRHAEARSRMRREAKVLTRVREVSPIPVPELTVIECDEAFSSHRLLKGEQILPADYEAFSDETRNKLASDVASFLAALHSIPVAEALAAGAMPIGNFSPVESISAFTQNISAADGLKEARHVVAAFVSLPPDPLGQVFGHFDCHGWNMAFDHTSQCLNGIFDFGDSGIGNAHRDFVYPSLLSPQHAMLVADHYERCSGKRIDRKRLALLIGYHRLMEMADYHHKPELFAYAASNWKNWRAFAIKYDLF